MANALAGSTSAVKGDRPRKVRSPLWAKLLIGFGSVVMVASIGTAVLVNVVVAKVTGAITTQNLLGVEVAGAQSVPGAPQVPAGASIDGAIDMLLIGLDTRISNPSMGSRSDSIIIAHIPPSHDRVYLISIPRDTWVTIPGHGQSKINAAFLFGSENGGGNAGGTALLAKTIKSVWGITFQGAAIIQFDGFKDIVRKLGGVRMYVDERTVSLHDGYLHGTNTPAAPFIVNSDGTRGRAIKGVDPVIYTVGWHTLTPKEALDFVRCRDGLIGTDYGRQRHQQQFIKALLEQAYAQGMSDFTKLDSFLSSISQAFIFDPGTSSKTDWIFTLKGINPASIVTIRTNKGDYFSAHIQGTSAEAMSPDSLTLLQAVKDDKIDEFLAAHPGPDWVASS